jgi:hypothetical protein
MAMCRIHRKKIGNDAKCLICKSCKHENFYQTEKGFRSGICECNSCGKRFKAENPATKDKEIWVLWGSGEESRWITPKEAQKKLEDEIEGKCLYCGKELDKNKGAKYCNDSHRMSFKREGSKTRTSKDQKPEQNQNYYDSAEYKQLVKELEEKTVEELEQQGYYIPNWKRIGYKSKSELISKLNIGTADTLDF